MTTPLRWGVLGTAGIARSQVVPAIQASRNGRVTAVAGRDPARTAAFAADFAIPQVHAGYAALVADDDVEAVYIPLPNSLHADWAMRCADAGKAVLCEKPLALDAAEARAVTAHFAALGVPLMEAFMYRFHPQNEQALALLEGGAIGDVRSVDAHLSVDIMAAAGADIRFDAGLGGGSLLDMGCYAVDVARRIMGGEPTAALAHAGFDPASGVDLDSAALLLFPGGRTASISCSFRAGGQGFYRVVGTRGVLEVPRAFIPGMGSRIGEGLVIVGDADGRRTETVVPPVDQYRLMVEAFADAVRAGRPVPTPPENAVATLRALDAIAAAARTRRLEEV